MRINQLVQGPTNSSNQIQSGYVSAVKTQENGQAVYRLYTNTISDNSVSFVSTDSLNFVLEAQPPVAGNDPQAMVLPNGYIWYENDFKRL